MSGYHIDDNDEMDNYHDSDYQFPASHFRFNKYSGENQKE